VISKTLVGIKSKKMRDLLFAFVSCYSNAKIIEIGEDLMELQCAIDWHVFLWITVYKYAH